MIPKTEGFSYNVTSPEDATLRPIPMFGYCINSITIRRLPVDNGLGVFLAPSTGTPALNVDVGIMAGFGWGAAGTFTKLQTITIPAGQWSVTTAVFWPVLSGTPLAYQSSSEVILKADVNFQPSIHSTFDNQTVLVNGSPYSVGYYNGPAFYDSNVSMWYYPTTGIATALPISATVFNDLNTLLGLLP